MKTVWFDGRRALPRAVSLGVEQDNGVEQVLFVLPQLAPGQVEVLYWRAENADAADAVALEDGLWRITSAVTQYPGDATCTITISDGDTLLWHSEPFCARVYGLPDVEGTVLRLYPTAILAGIEAAAEARAARSAAEAAAQAAQARAGAAAEQVEAARAHAEAAQASAEAAQACTEAAQAAISSVDKVIETVAPINLFNKDSEQIKAVKRVKSSGDYGDQTNSNVTHPIAITPGKTYAFLFAQNNFYGDSMNRVVRYCKSDGTLGDGQNATVMTDETTSTKYGVFTAADKGEDYRWVVVNVNNGTLATMMFVEGDSLPAEYSAWFEPCRVVREAALPANLARDPLWGKSAAFEGDSICKGDGYAGGYAGIIGAAHNMTITNNAVSGATLATGTTYAAGGNRHWISSAVANLPEGCDYYIIEGGVNDAAASNGVQLGELTALYTDTLDTTTLIGAMETICKTLQTAFPGRKYGFIIPHNTYATTHQWNTAFRPAMHAALKKWGIPCLDLSEETAQLNNVAALKAAYTDSGDGWHPNEDGYRLFYVDKIAAWMRTL